MAPVEPVEPLGVVPGMGIAPPDADPEEEPCSLEPLGVVPGMGIAPPDPEGTLV